MANLKLKNPAGGSLNFVSADGASDLTVTFPAKTGTAMVSGNMPAFYTNISTNQTVTNGSTTKILFNSETYDTNNLYDSTNSRFLPNIAGYYQLSCAAYVGSSASSFLTIYKNGSAFARGTQVNSSVSMQQASVLMYMNGTTDYAEVYFTNNTGSSVVVEGYDFTTNFTGFLARAA
jgi:hypothetical protein